MGGATAAPVPYACMHILSLKPFNCGFDVAMMMISFSLTGYGSLSYPIIEKSSVATFLAE